MNLLTVTNLSAGYAGKQVIKDISFFVAPKTIVGILGANGCGKTTLIKAIANLLPHTGSCQLDDTTWKTLLQGSLLYSADTFPKRAVFRSI